MSQDLLDKQIEMLERKYGGVKARNAALTIQRAFRRYTLLKKFAAITAMAKAEKRLSRKLQEAADRQELQEQRLAYHSQVYMQPTPTTAQQLHQPHQSPLNRPTPTRSMSLRERRHGGAAVHVDGSSHVSPIARGHGNRCEIQITSHQVNALSDTLGDSRRLIFALKRRDNSLMHSIH